MNLEASPSREYFILFITKRTFRLFHLFIQVQKIVDHHHASDQRSATKVRFTEPSEENGEMFNEEDEDYKVCCNKNNFIIKFGWQII